MAHSLDTLLHPQSIAVIGASDTPSRIGGRPIHFMLADHFQGRIYPVNPNRATVQGLRAYASIREVPEAVDCAIVSVPADIAVQALRDCAASGVKSAVVFTSGFAEMDERGKAAQDEIAALARNSAMRIVGPNCLGVFTVDIAWYATFASVPNMLKTPPGPVAIASQSGAYGAHIFIISQNRGIGSNYWVTTGNEVDVDVAEVIEYYAQTPTVRVIVAYAEGVKDGARMCRALDSARAAQKPVIFMKVGRTEVGAQAAASHTASLAGADAVYDAMFRQYGVYRAQTTEEMLDVAYACQFGKYPRGNKISVQTISGGVGVQMADAAVAYGLQVTPLPERTQKKLKTLIPFAAVRNPVDFTAQALNQPGLVEENIDLTIKEADYDLHAVYLAGVASSPFTRDQCLRMFTSLRRKHPDEAMLISFTGPRELIAAYEALDYPVIEDPALCVRAAAALAHFGEVFRRGRPDPAPALPRQALAAPDRPVAEHRAKAILTAAGIPMTRDRLADTVSAALMAWREVGAPVVLKIASPDIQHKTEIGGVVLNLNDEQAVASAYTDLIERARGAVPHAQIDGVIVSEMINDGVETVLGVICDPVFGPVVMFGLGGILVEVLKDVSFRLAPFGLDEARRMIDEIKGRAVLDGVRGAASADINALAEALARLSVFAHENRERIESIDINPFMVRAKGQGAVGVDALIVTRPLLTGC